MSLTDEAYRQRKWKRLGVLQSVIENPKHSQTYTYLSSSNRFPSDYLSDLVSVFELLETYLIENKGTFSNDHLEIKNLLCQDLQVLAQMLADMGSNFNEAAHKVAALSQS
jgi:hypothetical protein